MSCLCTTNTLRLFIKTVTQVELPATALRGPQKQWQKAARNFSSSYSHRRDDIAFERGPPKVQSESTSSKPWPQGASEEGITYEAAVQAIAPSPKVRSESIQSNSRPSKPDKAEARKFLRSLSKVARRKLERYDPVTKEPKPIARRTKTENKSFTLHFSAPRAPPTPAPLKADPKPKTASRHTKVGDDWKPPPREHWQLNKAALKEKFPEGWQPLKKLSPDALAGIRALHAQAPEQYTTEVLADSFKISPEAIRRILKSKWTPNADEETDRQRRWVNRGKSIYQKHADAGQKPPKMWRDMGIGDGMPEWMRKKPRSAKRAPMPALITTSRARDAKYGVGNGWGKLEDTIL